MKQLNYLWAFAGFGYSAYRLMNDFLTDTAEIQAYYLQEAVISYLYQIGTPLPWGGREYRGSVYAQSSVGENQTRLYESLGRTPRGFIIQGRPIWASFEKSDEYTSAHLQLRYLRGLFDPNRFMQDATQWYSDNVRLRSGYRVSRYVGKDTHISLQGGNDQVTSGRMLTDSATNISYGRHSPLLPQAETILKECRTWMNLGPWYAERHQPWRRGYLLYGSPGTGKSTVARAIAMDLDVPLLYYDLSSMTNDSFMRWWESGSDYRPCVMVWEDLDTVFNQRENITQNPEGMTWDCLLAALDYAQGVILFVTTNHPEKLDPSLAHVDVCDNKHEVQVRPGRIDKAIHFEGVDKATAFQVACHILGDVTRAQIIAGEMAGMTVAAVQEACIQEAMREIWDTSHQQKGTL